LTISVCIATHQRPRLLAGTLEALGNQRRPPDEIIVSDSSRPDSGGVIAAFSNDHPFLKVMHVPSVRKVLPWHRWWAFKHSHGDVILFLDDDITLTPTALEDLERAYDRLEVETRGHLAGIGFLLLFGSGATRNVGSPGERWLKTAGLRNGTVTPGGLTVTITGLTSSAPVEVDVLSGGAMSYRRQVLEEIFELDNLVALYEAGIGRGEDAVLSCYARKMGKLFVLNQPVALHPDEDPDIPTPYFGQGWRGGLTQTFGRAHTMRWIATDWSSYKKDWWRIVALEVTRSSASIIRQPWKGRNWLNLAGVLYGTALTLFRWKRIPSSAGSGSVPPRLNGAFS
jgi:glycosyltransferase involved in cell wall biosynthesis